MVVFDVVVVAFENCVLSLLLPLQLYCFCVHFIQFHFQYYYYYYDEPWLCIADHEYHHVHVAYEAAHDVRRARPNVRLYHQSRKPTLASTKQSGPSKTRETVAMPVYSLAVQ